MKNHNSPTNANFNSSVKHKRTNIKPANHIDAKQHIKFYIIVPIFNVENYLRECLDSLLAQSYKNFVAILVNDGSTDKSFQIALEYANNDSRLKILSQDNQGVSQARNRGLNEIFTNHYIVGGGVYCFFRC